MTISAESVTEYLSKVPEERQAAFSKLRAIILENLPSGFTEELCYGMVGYVVPHNIYPAGYHCKPAQALPFINIASQKNFIAFYHMGIYSSPELLNWFQTEFPKHSSKKLDMGKSCIRFKKPEDIPFELIGQLVQKMSVADWINQYESAFKK